MEKQYLFYWHWQLALVWTGSSAGGWISVVRPAKTARGLSRSQALA
jgi:hypothetical protein